MLHYHLRASSVQSQFKTHIFLAMFIFGVDDYRRGHVFFLYLILGNVEEGFSGGEKVNTPYKSFPSGPAIVFP